MVSTHDLGLFLLPTSHLLHFWLFKVPNNKPVRRVVRRHLLSSDNKNKPSTKRCELRKNHFEKLLCHVRDQVSDQYPRISFWNGRLSPLSLLYDVLFRLFYSCQRFFPLIFRFQVNVSATVNAAKVLIVWYPCIMQSAAIFWVLRSRSLSFSGYDAFFIHTEAPNRLIDSMTNTNSRRRSLSIAV